MNIGDKNKQGDIEIIDFTFEYYANGQNILFQRGGAMSPEPMIVVRVKERMCVFSPSFDFGTILSWFESGHEVSAIKQENEDGILKYIRIEDAYFKYESI